MSSHVYRNMQLDYYQSSESIINGAMGVLSDEQPSFADGPGVQRMVKEIKV